MQPPHHNAPLAASSASASSASTSNQTGHHQPPALRHGVYIEKDGYLSKKSSNVFRHAPLFHSHPRHRFLRIRGSNLKVFRSATDKLPELDLPLQNVKVVGHAQSRDIELRTWDEAVHEFHAEDEASFHDWYEALLAASERSIKDYYAFVRTLGQGHFGMVLLAKDRRSRDKFAVKIIKKRHAEERSLTLIQRELAILRLVNHHNIVRLYDLFDSEDKLYFVLEYMPGGALYHVLSEDETIFSEERASLIVKDILHGLAYLHANNIVHRDVKPENILTTGSRWPFTSKLADFGLSNFLAPTDGLVSKVGTPYFCAREVVTNDSYGTKADLWSLGVVAYEMLSGRKPFEGNHTKSVLYAILDGRWSFPPAEWAAISHEAKDFISQLICVDVNRRLSAEQALRHPWILNEGTHQPIPKRIPSLGPPAAITHIQSDEIMEIDDDDDS